MLFAGCLRAQLLSASKRGFLLGLRHKTHATSVYKEEARKLLLLNGAALVLAAFAGFGIYQGVTAESYIGPDEIYYAYYMKHTSGPFTQESYDWLEEQGEEFAPMLEVQRKVAAGELSSDAMLAFSSLQQKYSVYSRVINQNINYYLKEHPGAWLVYESGYKELFGFTGDADVQDTLLAGLACALCFSGLFSMERRGGMETILCTTPLQEQVENLKSVLLNTYSMDEIDTVVAQGYLDEVETKRLDNLELLDSERCEQVASVRDLYGTTHSVSYKFDPWQEAWAKFKLDGRYDTFEANILTSDDTSRDANISVEIYVDDVLVGRVDNIVRDENVRPISVSVNGGKVLMIKAINTDSASGSICYVSDTNLTVLQ